MPALVGGRWPGSAAPTVARTPTARPVHTNTRSPRPHAYPPPVAGRDRLRPRPRDRRRLEHARRHPRLVRDANGGFDAIDVVYCTDIRARIHLTTTPGAKDLSTLDAVEDVTVFDESGNLVSSWKTVSHSTGMFGAGDEAKVFEVSHTNVKDENHCTFTPGDLVEDDLVIDDPEELRPAPESSPARPTGRSVPPPGGTDLDSAMP
jgi:hypothetical protein